MSRHHYDTVAFDVRDNTTMLFFAKTAEHGDIADYLLLMRSVDDDFNELQTIEVNDAQVSNEDLIEEAHLMGNTLTLKMREVIFDGLSELTLTFEETADNFSSIEAGAFRVLGDALKGGSA